MLLLTSVLFCLLAAALTPASAFGLRKAGFNVLGGEDVSTEDYDFVVGISTKLKNAKTGTSCSGSIIDDLWILTAGHCIKNTNPSTHTVEIEAGSKQLSGAHVIEAEKWFTYDSFVYWPYPTQVFNDIALIKLKEPVTKVPNTTVAILPADGESAPRSGSTVKVVGFGIEGVGLFSTKTRNVLKIADMKVQSFCLSTHPYCIKAVQGNGRACSGDSGGPMVYNGKVVGVGSTGETCTTTRGDAEYTTVSRYVKWINDKIKQG